MSISRRDLLKLGGLTAVTLSASACRVIGQQLASDELPETLTLQAAEFPVQETTGLINPAWRFLNRAGYGPRPGELEQVTQKGFEAYLEEQLNPEQIEDTAVDLMLRNMTLYQMDVSQLAAQEPEDAAKELIGTTIFRAVYSKRQLYEAMVEFWSDHFNIYLRKNRFMPLLKIIDDRDVIRPHALGKFRDLLFASANSPAMLVYLDNVHNQKGQPNENYARELMELHTLGVDAGYTQQDVSELARALTGWGIGRRGRRRGQFFFDGDQHDFGPKSVLGHELPAGQGEEDVKQILELFATHPSTASFIATKLVRRFVAENPPQALVDQVTRIFQETDGDIKQMLRIIFLSEEFATAPPKLKRPFTFMVSALRALHADFGLNRQIGRWLQLMGQPLFHWPPPDGYPDDSTAWAANLLPRWNFALALVHGRLVNTTVPLERIVRAGGASDVKSILELFVDLLFGRSLDDETLGLFSQYVREGPFWDETVRPRLKDAVALMIASPAFQWM